MTRIIIIITAVIAAAALIYTGSVLLGSNTEPTTPLPTQEQVDALIDWEEIAISDSAFTEHGMHYFFVETCSECGVDAVLATHHEDDAHCFACGERFSVSDMRIVETQELDIFRSGTYSYKKTTDIDTARVWLSPHVILANPVVQDMIEDSLRFPPPAPIPLNWDPDMVGTPIEHFI